LRITLVPPLPRYLIETFGQRCAYVGLGVVLFAVAFPAVPVLVRESPPRRTRPFPMGGPTLPGLGVAEALTGSSGCLPRRCSWSR
jgi:hypothetical protein